MSEHTRPSNIIKRKFLSAIKWWLVLAPISIIGIWIYLGEFEDAIKYGPLATTFLIGFLMFFHLPIHISEIRDQSSKRRNWVAVMTVLGFFTGGIGWIIALILSLGDKKAVDKTVEFLKDEKDN